MTWARDARAHGRAAAGPLCLLKACKMVDANPTPTPTPTPNPTPTPHPDQVLKTVDVSYGGENGFNQAIELSSETLQNVKFVQEKKLISKYFEEISQDTGKFCFGIKDTLQALEMGAVQTLIVFENEPTMRYTVKNASTAEEKVRSIALTLILALTLTLTLTPTLTLTLTLTLAQP